MKSDLQDLRYRIGDLLGDHAPGSFRRRSSSTEWIIGLGSIIAAAGISYLAMRMADRRLSDVMRRFIPRHSAERDDLGTQASETTGTARVPEAAHPEMFSPREREPKSRTSDIERTQTIAQPSGNQH